MEKQKELEKLIEWLTPYDSPEKADLLIIFGNYTFELCKKAAELYKKSFVKKILVTGKTGNFGSKNWKDTIAETLKRELMSLGVSANDIILQPESTNTFEDVLFSKKIIAENVGDGGTIILVARPIQQLRSYATIKKQLPQFNYINQPCNLDSVDDTYEVNVVRCLQEVKKIETYSRKGDILNIEIPAEIKSSCTEFSVNH